MAPVSVRPEFGTTKGRKRTKFEEEEGGGAGDGSYRPTAFNFAILVVSPSSSNSPLRLSQEFDQQRKHLVAVLAGKAEGKLGGEEAVVEIEIVAAA